MAGNRIKTTTTTTGTGNITVSATPAPRCRPLSDLPVNAVRYFLIEDESGTDWELCRGTVLSATTFSRDAVIEGSNGTSKVNFAAGTKTVFRVIASEEFNDVATKADSALAAASAAGSGVVNVAFTNVIPLSQSLFTLMADTNVSSKITFAPSSTQAAGARVQVGLIADGVTANAPDLSAFQEDNSSGGYDNRVGVRNRITFWYDGVEKLYSISQAAASVTAPTATVSGVTISPATVTLAGGGAQTFTATVAGTNSPSQGVTWTASAGTITSGGVFTAPAATASAQNITITATSTVDTSKSGTATATVSATGTPAATVSSVTVSPAAANVAGSATQQFTATVAGTNSPSQNVTWATDIGTISAGGLYTAPAATASVQTATITATSTVDTSKSGTATATTAATAATIPDTNTTRLNRLLAATTESTAAPWEYTGTGTDSTGGTAAATSVISNPGTTDCSAIFKVMALSGKFMVQLTQDTALSNHVRALSFWNDGVNGYKIFREGPNAVAPAQVYQAAVGDLLKISRTGVAAAADYAVPVTWEISKNGGESWTLLATANLARKLPYYIRVVTTVGSTLRVIAQTGFA